MENMSRVVKSRRLTNSNQNKYEPPKSSRARCAPGRAQADLCEDGNMKERPILFSAPMVRAILDGSKNQTRRIVKPQPPDGCTVGWSAFSGENKIGCRSYAIPHQSFIKCPYVMRQILWVKETFYYDICPYANGGSLKVKPDDFIPEHFYYRADGTEFEQIPECEGNAKWRPSIFMPRWASRITLEITEVRVERLQDICKNDVIAEGTPGFELEKTSEDEARACYRELWKSINGKGSWQKNPWVWVLTFKQI